MYFNIRPVCWCKLMVCAVRMLGFFFRQLHLTLFGLTLNELFGSFVVIFVDVWMNVWMIVFDLVPLSCLVRLSWCLVGLFGSLWCVGGSRLCNFRGLSGWPFWR